MKRHVLFAIGCVLALGTLPQAFAAWPSSIRDDVEAWEAIDQRDERAMTIEQDEAAFYESDELFPDVGGGASSSSASDVVTVTVGGETIAFNDVPTTAWFAPYVREIATRGIVSGYRNLDGTATGMFGPADNVTIDQVAKVLTLAAGHIAACDFEAQNATASGTWSSYYVGCAEFLGWSLYADATVNVKRPATRAEVIVSLLQAYKITPDERTGDVFTDVTASTQFGSFIEQAKRDGIVSGYTDASGNTTGTFGPSDPVTRAEFAKIITLGMQVYGQ